MVTKKSFDCCWIAIQTLIWKTTMDEQHLILLTQSRSKKWFKIMSTPVISWNNSNEPVHDDWVLFANNSNSKTKSVESKAFKSKRAGQSPRDVEFNLRNCEEVTRENSKTRKTRNEDKAIQLEIHCSWWVCIFTKHKQTPIMSSSPIYPLPSFRIVMFVCELCVGIILIEETSKEKENSNNVIVESIWEQLILVLVCTNTEK